MKLWGLLVKSILIVYIFLSESCLIYGHPIKKDEFNSYQKVDSVLNVTINRLDNSDHFKNLHKATSTREQKEQLLLNTYQILDLQSQLKFISIEGIERTLLEQIKKYSDRSSKAKNFLKNLKQFEDNLQKTSKLLYENNIQAVEEITKLLEEHRKVLLSNPLLENKEVLVIRQQLKNARQAMAQNIGRNKNNWSTNEKIDRKGWKVDICKLSDLQNNINVTSIYKTQNGYPLKDMDLNWDGRRLAFSSIGEHNKWHVFEYDLEKDVKTQLTPGKFEDVEYFDPCYLPNGKMILSYTGDYVAVPCVGGNSKASSICLLNPENQNIRQLNFGQESEWNPVVLNNGQVCYLRWEYTDNSHYFTRILMSMNPDGTTKKEYYGSDSYFPNSLFDVRPLPDHTSQFIGVVSGHHGIARSGRLLIFDPAKGRKEAEGVVQEIPGYGKIVEPIIKDRLVDGVWPQFLTPYPLNNDYFLVSAKLHRDGLWGIYLVDRFDNITLVHSEKGEAYAEPLVLEKKSIPPIIPEKVNLEDSTSVVYLMDIYEGPGLKGIPRGTVKQLRIYAYEYGYNKKGGHDIIGLESSWDVKRILGTVPVEEDGSATFRIPANTPISLQPLDENGSALQLMRSWLTGMPGEVLSCVGCHESQNSAPMAKFTIASRKTPSEIKPWYGSARPFSYNNEIKPVIEKRCVACHNANAKGIPDFSSDEDSGYQGFSKSYMALHPYVRRPGCESDFRILEPMDYYSNTSDLIQMLSKGHHGVSLSNEEWDRLVTWIDLNVPYRAEYDAPNYCGYDQQERRKELLKYFAKLNITSDKELAVATKQREERGMITPVLPENITQNNTSLSIKGWPISCEEAKKIQTKSADNKSVLRKVNIGSGIELEFVRIPAGKFVMGNNKGQPDQQEKIANIEVPFWMLKTEVTNKIFRTIFPDHDSRSIDQQWKDHIYEGYPANKDQMPVIRVSWNEAVAFCQKLSDKTGMKFRLPSEKEWEWAARAGTNTPTYYGNVDSDFSKYENLADTTIRNLAVKGVDPKPMKDDDERLKYYDFVPKEARYNDGILVPQGTAQFLPNPWGLYDMLGNVAEWTSSNYDFDKVGLAANNGSLKVAKGGSWRDRPFYATAATREGYMSYQKVFNVGFRLVVE